MGWYRLTWPKALIVFIIDAAGYIIFGPSLFIKALFPGTSFSPPSILLLRLDHMGDVLMATPAIIALKEHFPSARITVGVKEANCALISLPKIVDRVMGIDVPWVVNSSKNKRRQWISLLKKIRELREERFDLAIDFKGDLRNIIFLFLIGSKERVSYGIRGGGFLLTRKIEFLSGTRHEIERNLDIVRALAGDTEKTVPRYEVGPERKAEAWERLENLFPKKGKFIGIHPGANSRSKAWPPLYFAKLADEIEKEALWKTIIFGGPNEREVLTVIKSSLNSQPLILDDISLEDLASFFKKLDLFIGNDSGPFHLAEAVGTKVITIFGSTYPEIVGPVSADSEIIRSKKTCAPCRKPGEKEKCKNYDCLKEISVEKVYEVIQKKLVP